MGFAYFVVTDHKQQKIAIQHLVWARSLADKVAKVHVRYMVGGHQQGVEDEILYRFRFPERPGALLQFLTRLGRNWNISLFHYRNHGAAYGRVLCGIQVPQNERGQFQQFLDDLGYHYQEETDNPVYKLFLS